MKECTVFRLCSILSLVLLLSIFSLNCRSQVNSGFKHSLIITDCCVLIDLEYDCPSETTSDCPQGECIINYELNYSQESCHYIFKKEVTVQFEETKIKNKIEIPFNKLLKDDMKSEFSISIVNYSISLSSYKMNFVENWNGVNKIIQKEIFFRCCFDYYRPYICMLPVASVLDCFRTDNISNYLIAKGYKCEKEEYGNQNLPIVIIEAIKANSGDTVRMEKFVNDRLTHFKSDTLFKNGSSTLYSILDKTQNFSNLFDREKLVTDISNKISFLKLNANVGSSLNCFSFYNSPKDSLKLPVFDFGRCSLAGNLWIHSFDFNDLEESSVYLNSNVSFNPNLINPEIELGFPLRIRKSYFPIYARYETLIKSSYIMSKRYSLSYHGFGLGMRFMHKFNPCFITIGFSYMFKVQNELLSLHLANEADNKGTFAFDKYSLNGAIKFYKVIPWLITKFNFGLNSYKYIWDCENKIFLTEPNVNIHDSIGKILSLNLSVYFQIMDNTND